MPAKPGEKNGYDLEKFFSLAVDLFAIAGVDGYFRRVNPSFERVLGYTAEEMCSKPFVEFIHPDDRGETHAEVVKLSSGAPTISFENRYRCKDGSYRDLVWTAFPEKGSGLLYAVARDVTDWKRLQNRLDGLTGVANQRVFEEALIAEWNRAARFGASLAVGIVDVDQLKRFNDAYGYPAGDECLKRVAGVLSDRLRREGDLVARHGGDSFAMILTGLSDGAQATALLEELRRAIAALDIPNLSDAVDGRITASVGVAFMRPSKGRVPDALVEAAGAALANAKDAGGNRVVTADEG